MDLLETIGIAFALALDAFAVSVAGGVAIKDRKVRHAVRIALFFGGFQALMPLIGWLAGRGLKEAVAGIDHWLAFGLLTAVGCKMIWETLKLSPEERRPGLTNIPTLLVLSVATSLDALAVGVTISFLRVVIWGPIILIGAITFAVSLAGVFIGDRFGHWFESKAELAGGVVLIAIALKILLGSL